MTVRVRFCPSPTGYLHVGNVRTALYNWLFARQQDGAAVLRIEDTDRSREAEGAVDLIYRSLDWLGLHFDESPQRGGPYAPYVQSERADRYRAVVADLISTGAAYPCYQTPAELDAARAAARVTDDPASATRAHRDLTRTQMAAFEAAGRRLVVRYRTPLAGETIIHDLVKGVVRFEHRLLGDHVLMRADGIPTYQLANPVDDLDQRITHVIRGDDLLASTPRQVLLLSSLGAEYPQTAHLPMIVGADRQRLSKRHGATTIEDLRSAGYLPEAVVNYLALLGWSYDDKTEIMSLAELVERFTMERVNPAPAVFDYQKLAWMNGVYMRQLDPQRLAEHLRRYLRDHASQLADEPRLAEAAELVQSKITTLAEFPSFAGFVFAPVGHNEEAWQKLRDTPDAASLLDGYIAALDAVEQFTPAAIEASMRSVAERAGHKPRVAFLPARVAVSGATVSPGLFESMAFLGRDETLRRLRAAGQRL